MHKMKTIEEKAKAYDEALEIAKQFYYDESTRVGMTPIDIERMFPVLKESEDEKIRHFLISKMKEVGNVWKEYSAKDIIAWLEKQGKLVNEYEDKLDRCACENFNKGYEAAIKHQKEKQGEQKPAWSEEDERLRHSCITHIEDELEQIGNDKYGHSEIISDLKESCRERVKWLKSLKDRVFPQNTWKPSDELIQALERSADYLHDYGKNDDDLLLLRLLEELKKLKE